MVSFTQKSLNAYQQNTKIEAEIASKALLGWLHQRVALSQEFMSRPLDAQLIGKVNFLCRDYLGKVYYYNYSLPFEDQCFKVLEWLEAEQEIWDLKNAN